MKLKLLLLFFVILPGCSINKPEETNPSTLCVEVYDLNESTDIIISLLKKDALKKVLAESDRDKDRIDTLIKNFSPSEMAFEAEVLNHNNSVVILYYDPTVNNDEIITKLTELAKKYENDLKFVKIDKDKLFYLAKQSEIDDFPTLMIMHNRNEVGRLEKPIITTMEKEIQKILKAD